MGSEPRWNRILNRPIKPPPVTGVMKTYTELDMRLGLVKLTPEQQRFIEEITWPILINAHLREVAKTQPETAAWMRAEFQRRLAKRWQDRSGDHEAGG